MATLMWQRDIASDVGGVRNTFSSWDACMSKTYCKWPAITGIILGSIIAFSLLWCLFRCLCCGAECCCGCLACCNACCPSPRGGRNKGYQQPPPPPQAYPQYHSPQPPMYAAGGAGYAAGGAYRGAQTATFDAPSKGSTGRYNEDALPAMPSWDTASSRRVETQDVEMEQLDHPKQSQQRQALLSNNGPASPSPYYNQQQPQQQYTNGGDIGSMNASPYHNYDDHRQFAPSPVYSQQGGGFPSQNRVTSPVSAYEPSLYPPSYHTSAPAQASYGGQQIGRKPVQGTWRDV